MFFIVLQNDISSLVKSQVCFAFWAFVRHILHGVDAAGNARKWQANTEIKYFFFEKSNKIVMKS